MADPLADVRAILDALGLGTHARPYSAHEVVHRDILPAIRRLVEGDPYGRVTLTGAVSMVPGPTNKGVDMASVDGDLKAVPIETLWAELVRRSVAGEYPEGWPKVTLRMILDLPRQERAVRG